RLAVILVESCTMNHPSEKQQHSTSSSLTTTRVVFRQQDGVNLYLLFDEAQLVLCVPAAAPGFCVP
ncbi:unnamed protein product, partial [Amoebophrya sp. A25]